mgnify:CR=1 FL=1
MNFFGLMKRVWTLAAVVSTFYFIYQLVFSPFPYIVPHAPFQVNSIGELLWATIILLTILSLAMVSIIFGVGYLVFTGWKHRSGIPWPFKLVLAFLLGILVFALAAPISLIVKVPFAPTLASAVILWVALRVTSRQITPSMRGISLDQAINKVRQTHIALSGGRVIEVKEATLDGTTWLVKIQDENGGGFEYRIDANAGEVRGWRRTY